MALRVWVLGPSSCCSCSPGRARSRAPPSFGHERGGHPSLQLELDDRPGYVPGPSPWGLRPTVGPPAGRLTRSMWLFGLWEFGVDVLIGTIARPGGKSHPEPHDRGTLPDTSHPLFYTHD